MTFDLNVLAMARGLAAHAGQRQTLISQNVANADTRRYEARDLKPFADVYAGGKAEQAFAARATRPGHAGFTAAGREEARPYEVAKLGAASPNGNSVSLEDQMARGAEAMKHHEMAVTIMRKTIDILRVSIGRAR